MEENNTELEQVEEVDEIDDKPKSVKKTFWDYNLSWVLLIALAVACIFIGQANIRTLADEGVKIGNNILYILLQVLLSIAAGTLFYSLGKIIGGSLSGYRLLYIQIFGFKLGFPGGKYKFSLPNSIGSLLDFRLVMTPKKENPNPLVMLLSGPIFTIALQGAMIGIGFVIKSELVKLSILFACGYIACVILYQWFPIRTDNFNDGFIFLKTRSLEDRQAYNLTLVNRDRDEAHLPLVTKEFANYDTYMKANYEYYVYLANLYQDDLEQAVIHLNNCAYYLPYMSFENRIKIEAERIFLLVIADSIEEADKTFRFYSHDDRSVIERPYSLVSFRTAILVAGVIESEYNRSRLILRRFNALVATLEKNPRVEKELYLFDLCYTKIKELHPEWDLETDEEEDADENEESHPKVKKARVADDDDENEEDEED